MPVGSVTAYQAGLESTNTAMSYALESAWATLPAATFQGMRIISESLKHTKTRSRPGEIRGDRQAAPGLTTQEAASGSIVMPVFYAEAGRSAQFDDFMSCLVGGDWQLPTTITGAGGDIALSSSGALTSTTAGKFSAITVGQILKLSGFTNTINNGFYRVAAAASGTSLTLAAQGFTPVSETPAAAAAKVYFSNLKNSTFFKTLFLQQRLDPLATKWFRYPGAYPTRGQVSLSLGQFLQATFDMGVQQELKGLADASTGGIIPPPNTLVMDPVGGFKGVFWNDAPLSAGCDQFSLDLNNDGAGGQFALGSALAQGMKGGTFTASGSFRIYIKDMALYDAFRAETRGVLSIRTGDQAGNQYSFTMPNALLLLNDGVPVDGANNSLMGTFSLEASPDTASGCTLSIDRFPFTA